MLRSATVPGRSKVQIPAAHSKFRRGQMFHVAAAGTAPLRRVNARSDFATAKELGQVSGGASRQYRGNLELCLPLCPPLCRNPCFLLQVGDKVGDKVP